MAGLPYLPQRNVDRFPSMRAEAGKRAFAGIAVFNGMRLERAGTTGLWAVVLTPRSE
jgi:hypothetical protein